MSSILFYSTRKSKIFREKIFEKKFSKKSHTQKNGPSGALKSHNAEKLKGGPFGVFQHPFCRKTWKNWRKQKLSFSGKNLTMPKKNWKGGPFGIFQHPFCRKTSKKCRGTLWRKIFFRKKKSRSAEKNEWGEPLVSPGMVCYAEKQEKPFWFSSLDQIVHFGAIIFCRTFIELFWSVHVDRKKSHYNSRVSLHEAPTKNDQKTSIYGLFRFSKKLSIRSKRFF